MNCLRALVLGLLCAACVFCQSTVFVVRHADRYGSEPDPSITEEGRRQAVALAALLADSRITRIFTSDALRTHQTAAPTAQHFRLKPIAVPSENLDELIRQVRQGLRDGESTLIVGHRGTVPRIVKALTGKEVPPLQVDEYDRLEVLTLVSGSPAGVITLRFGH